jgi:hypothetical protein
VPDSNGVINLGDLSKPITVFIEKLSNAVGLLYEPSHIRQKARAEAYAEKIRAAASIEVSEIQQRGLRRLVLEEGRRQENMERIAEAATGQLGDNAKPEGMDDDWIANFFDKCRNVSDREMPSLWSRLLAGEATRPGSFSKRTIELVSVLDKEDAGSSRSFVLSL